METARAKQKLKESFKDTYEHLCALQNSCPLTSITANLQEEFIDCNADRIRHSDWTPIMNSLKSNNSLRFLALRSFWQQTKQNEEGISQQRAYILRKRIPAIRSRDITLKICKSLKECLTVSGCIECIVLQGIPLREQDLNSLAKGIGKNKSLKHISFEHCRFGDGGLAALSSSLKKSSSLQSVNFCGCGLTWRGADIISDIIKHQATKRHGDAWQESLRYRRPDLNGMCGLRRINLCQNTLIGDKGAQILADCLKDDLWMKALDLQQCGLSSQGAEALIAALDFNRSLRVLDVRVNPLLDRSTVRTILEKVMTNAGGEDAEYPWITVKEPKDAIRTKLSRKPIRFTLNKSITKAQGLRQKNRSSKQRKLVKMQEHVQVTEVTKKNAKHLPWRTAARLERNKYKSRNPLENFGDAREEIPFEKPQETRNRAPQNVISEMDRLSLEDLNEEVMTNDFEIRDLKIQLIDYKRRYENELAQKAKVDVRVKELEMENRKLRNEVLLLKTSEKETSTHRLRQDCYNLDALEDENVLENIEASFRQFQKFLDLIKNTNLADLYRLLEEESSKDA